MDDNAPGLNCVIDLYHGDENVDFAQVARDGVLAVIHKTTQGTDAADTAYAARRPQVLEAGLLWGAYHFGTGVGTAADQVAFFLERAAPDGSTLLVLDFEKNHRGPTMTLDMCREFVQGVYDAVHRWPVLYSGDLIKETLGATDDPLLANCPLWIPRYSPSWMQQPVLPATWQRWTLWQYTDGTYGPPPRTCLGVGACDRNLFNGDADALGQFWGSAAAGD
jgi:lysozyme